MKEAKKLFAEAKNLLAVMDESGKYKLVKVSLESDGTVLAVIELKGNVYSRNSAYAKNLSFSAAIRRALERAKGTLD